MNSSILQPLFIALLFAGCAVQPVSTQTPKEPTLDIVIPSSKETSEVGADYLTYYQNMVWELARESDDIPTLAKIIEYRVAQSEQFKKWNDFVTRAMCGQHAQGNTVSSAYYFKTKEWIKQSEIEKLHSQLPSDILDAKMKQRKLPKDRQ